jgi:hypothetical protein
LCRRVSNSFKFIATLAEGEDMSLAFSRYHSLMFPPWKLKNAVDSQRSQSAECEIVGAKVSVKDANSPLGINTGALAFAALAFVWCEPVLLGFLLCENVHLHPPNL